MRVGKTSGDHVGKVRPSYIKRTTRQLLDAYPDRFSDDFEENKRAVMELTDIKSKRVRNRVAGYITRLVKRKRLAIKKEAELPGESAEPRQEEGEE